jgi:nucleotide-binding universal stress UspA family protein
MRSLMRSESKLEVIMIVTRKNGWTIDTQGGTLAWPDHADATKLPDVTLASLVYFGLGYLESQAAARTVNDTFRKAWLAEHEGSKAADVPHSAVPASDSEEYRAALAEAHAALYDKLAAGYEVGVHEGTGDPLADEVDKIARDWLQGLAQQFTHQGKPWYVLPPKHKVARDDDPYNGPKYATFGEALAAFKVSASPAGGKLVGKTADGKAWPFKMRPGHTVAEAIVAEAARRVAERAAAKAKSSVTLADGEDVVI